jgi:hypothetical protein
LLYLKQALLIQAAFFPLLEHQQAKLRFKVVRLAHNLLCRKVAVLLALNTQQLAIQLLLEARLGMRFITTAILTAVTTQTGYLARPQSTAPNMSINFDHSPNQGDFKWQ